MRRLVVPDLILSKGQAQLPREAVRHIQVLRLDAGDELLILDGQGNRAQATILAVTKTDVTVQLSDPDQEQLDELPPLGLIQGLAKGQSKMDEIIRRATEIGVNWICPVICSRSVPRLSDDRKKKRAERWQKIVREASRQCKRPRLAHLYPPISFAESLELHDKRSLGIIMWEDESTQSLSNVLGSSDFEHGITLIIGPEGGFSSEEVELARSRGFHSASMGSLVLRTETAAIAACSIAQYCLGALELEK